MDSVPVAGLSMFDRVFLGMDEDGRRVEIELVYRNLLIGGEPGARQVGGAEQHRRARGDVRRTAGCGCSTASRSSWACGPTWLRCSSATTSPTPSDRLRDLQAEMDARYAVAAPPAPPQDRAHRPGRPDRRASIDEVAYYSATVGKKQDQEEFSRLLRDVVARGRAAGVIVIAATQRPSVDIIPTSLRDLFGYRLAFRCTTEISSDIILGHGWAKAGYDASKIARRTSGSAGCGPRAACRSGSSRRYLTDAADLRAGRLRRLAPHEPQAGPATGPQDAS